MLISLGLNPNNNFSFICQLLIQKKPILKQYFNMQFLGIKAATCKKGSHTRRQ